MNDNTPSTNADLMAQAAKALAKRDPYRLEQLEQIAEGWLEDRAEKDARRSMLQVMQEAAHLLDGEPTDMGWPEDDE